MTHDYMLGIANNNVNHTEQKIFDNVRMNLQERINYLFESTGKKQAHLAKALGVTRTTVNDWKSGKTKSISRMLVQP